MPVTDFVALVEQLDEQWGPHEENTARLLEAQAYSLELDWADRTADPDDEETRRARAKAKRDGIKPPSHPMIPPVALRPPKLAEQVLEAFISRVTEHQAPKEEGSAFLDRAQFDRAMGFV